MTMQGYPMPAPTTTSVRPITEIERSALERTLRPMRTNAIGIAFMSILMAVLINFVTDPIAVVLPIFFGMAALGMAFQTRKSVTNVGKALSSGTVTEIRSVPRIRNPGRVWDLGAFTSAGSGEISKMISEGVPASFTVLPESKYLLAVNGVMLRKPSVIAVVPGIMSPPAQTVPAVPVQPVMQRTDEELPPPPEDWVVKSCPMCGQNVESNMMFCAKCGFRLKA